MEKVIGKTKHTGYQFGLRKTFPISPTAAWDFMVSSAGVNSWMGEIAEMQFRVNFEFQTMSGNTGKITVVKPFSHIRMTWKKPDWSHQSIVQWRIIKVNEEKTTISIHQEKLNSAIEREEMKLHWQNVMFAIEKQLQNPT